MNGPLEDPHLRRVTSLQIGLLLIATPVTAHVWGLAAAQGVLFGVLIALVNTMLLRWRLGRQGAQGEQSAQRQLRQFFRSWLERYAAVILLLALGLAGFKLAAPALIAGFALGQLVWIVAPMTLGKSDA